MNLSICENLKEQRKKKNNTQEDLAGFLDVSVSAVSKWERGECYPDIELLPKIASYYDISVDDLLGVSEIKKKERINEYQNRASDFAHIGDEKAKLAVWREAQKEYPNDWTVLYGLLYSLNYEEHSQEIIEIGEKILAQCTDNNCRYGAMQVLCFLYSYHLKDKEKAKEYASMAPILYVTSDILLSHVLEGDELAEHSQSNIIQLTELLGQEIFNYARRKGGIESDERKRAYHMALKVYELTYEDGDFGFYACRISEIYGNLAKVSAEQQNKADTLEYLANSVKYAKIYDTQEDFKHTSLLVNRKSHGKATSSKNYMSNTSYLTLKGIEHKCYDFCRDDEEFVKLIEDLKEVAKENASE